MSSVQLVIAVHSVLHAELFYVETFSLNYGALEQLSNLLLHQILQL